MQRKGCSRMPRVQGTPTYHGYAAVDFPFDVSDIAKTELADVMQGTSKNKKNGNIFERWK